MTYFTDEQVKLLLLPISPRRVLQRDGMSYVEGYDIRAELTRVFGFARWTSELLDQALLCEREVRTKTYTDKKTGEEKGGRAAWYVVYRSRVRLTIFAPDGTLLAFHDGSHVGESTHPVFGDAHGNALTNSETYALRRAAINLGDQFGLSLYNKGSLDPIVRWTLVRPGTEAQAADTDDVPQVSAEVPDDAHEGVNSDGERVESAPAPDARQPAGDVSGNATAGPVHNGSNGNGRPRGQVSRPAQQPQTAPAAPGVDGKAVADWAAKIDEITSDEDADRAEDELREIRTSGRMDARTADAIRKAIRAKRAAVAQRETAGAR